MSKIFHPLHHPSPAVLLVPLVPGVTLPFSHMLPLFLAFSLASIFHEAGHAAAAASENITIQGFGLFLAFIYPGAYIEFPNHLLTISAKQRIKIFAAGPLLNIFLALLTLLVLFLLPLFTAPLAIPCEKGVFVESIRPPLPPEVTYSQLTRVSQCNVSSVQDFFECLHFYSEQNLRGFILDRHPSGPEKEKDVNVTELLTYERCNPDVDGPLCYAPTPEGTYFDVHFQTHLVIFAGEISSLSSVLTLSDRKPRFLLLFSCLQKIRSLLVYLSSISFAIGLINLLPCLYMDGHYLVQALAELSSPNLVTRWVLFLFRHNHWLVVLLALNFILSFIG